MLESSSLLNSEYAKLFAALLAIVNPIGAIPIFLNLTRDQSISEKAITAKASSFSVFVLLVVIMLTGDLFLKAFGITIASFRIAGGLLILLMALSMMHAHLSDVKQTTDEAKEAKQKDSIAIVPLGIPLLAGPGAITTIIIYLYRGNGWPHYLYMTSIILAVVLIVYAALRTAPYLAKALGNTGINVITRIMGLIMAAIGIEFIANGLRVMFPILVG